MGLDYLACYSSMVPFYFEQRGCAWLSQNAVGLVNINTLQLAEESWKRGRSLGTEHCLQEAWVPWFPKISLANPDFQ